MSMAGYDVYGREFLSSYWKHSDLPLTVYSEDTIGIGCLKPLQHAEKWSMLRNYPRHEHWALDAGRFAPKAFSIIDALDNATGEVVVWIDADTVLDAPLTEQRVRGYLGPHFCGVMLRENYHPCSSFMIYNTGHDDNARFVAEMKRMYHDKALMELPERHDAYIQGKILQDGLFDFTNLTPGAQPVENVFDWLGFGHHKKGNLKWKTSTSSRLAAAEAVSSPRS